MLLSSENLRPNGKTYIGVTAKIALCVSEHKERILTLSNKEKILNLEQEGGSGIGCRDA